jgi:X-Pro dipeptidyl-peptidase
MEMRNRWFSHYLYGVDNGVQNDPRLMVVREGMPRGSAPTAYADYPNPDAAAVTLYPSSGGNSIGALSFDAVKKAVAETLVDDVAFSGAELASAGKSEHRLLYATPVLADTLHLSGTPVVTISLASSKPAANLSVWLVTLPFDSNVIGSEGKVGVLTRGWADAQNYKSLTRGGNYASKAKGEPLVNGTFYDLTFDLQPGDRMIAPGKQLALMIMSSDRDFTLWPSAGTELMVDLGKTSIRLPVVGGMVTMRRAVGR